MKTGGAGAKRRKRRPIQSLFPSLLLLLQLSCGLLYCVAFCIAVLMHRVACRWDENWRSRSKKEKAAAYPTPPLFSLDSAATSLLSALLCGVLQRGSNAYKGMSLGEKLVEQEQREECDDRYVLSSPRASLSPALVLAPGASLGHAGALLHIPPAGRARAWRGVAKDERQQPGGRHFALGRKSSPSPLPDGVSKGGSRWHFLGYGRHTPAGAGGRGAVLPVKSLP